MNEESDRSGSEKLRIFLADDHGVLRSGLRRAPSRSPAGLLTSRLAVSCESRS